MPAEVCREFVLVLLGRWYVIEHRRDVVEQGVGVERPPGARLL
ncbi:hypothetical protein P8A19_41945 (plasmid) [Streptomyces poriferorum]|uniref:Uncharacterized protein n=1 Tax=Streptomyces poriferorum TaxID=2798799 RepID=A0ABY9J6R6_9ACTN|nr:MULTISPECIES: hypothetical protein [unclassified Streptomyces]MDP5317349.1 hypothetical protein [Streptomyces sp. Alt4]WLQ62039.1 hypothetical protein P8A19_41945 [Streptomyces sp. Alt2]